ncbi:MAG: signal peptidase II [Lachnospiraceae bacterium]|nr:signal peptidase II [Lachnospiraceae bacterium]
MTKRAKYNIGGIILAAVLIGLDQWTKALAVSHLKDQESIVLIKDVFQLHYLENRGAAFGMFQGQRWIFVILTVLVLVGLVYLYNRMPLEKRLHPLRFIGVALFAGAIGNFIDRTVQGYVVDFFYFELIDFPIFNVADCYVTVSAIALVILFIFYYKDEELAFISFSSKKKEAAAASAESDKPEEEA